MAINSVENIERLGYGFFEFDFNMDAEAHVNSKYCMIMLCTAGHGTLDINMTKVELEEGARVVLPHVLYVKKVELSTDFKAQMLIITPDLMHDIVMGMPIEKFTSIGNLMNVKVQHAAEWHILLNIMDVIKTYTHDDSLTEHRKVVGLGLRMMINVIFDYECRELLGNNKLNYSMADVYFKKFIDLLDDNIKTEHQVAFYAQQLNITPKYLGEITKQKTGHKAKEVISHILSMKIKRELLISGRSMKEIAYDYGFADQSSLGKFFRKETGESPTLYKKNLSTL